MKQSFLNSLADLDVVQADKLCGQEGVDTFAINHGNVVALITYPNTVLLWLKEDNQTVDTATWGDSLAEDDTQKKEEEECGNQLCAECHHPHKMHTMDDDGWQYCCAGNCNCGNNGGR